MHIRVATRPILGSAIGPLKHIAPQKRVVLPSTPSPLSIMINADLVVRRLQKSGIGSDAT